jgi:hypothetical protein
MHREVKQFGVDKVTCSANKYGNCTLCDVRVAVRHAVKHWVTNILKDVESGE